ncbi:MAG: nucleotidyltransferase domain-containing protein [Lachnospiraceae bacterium]
MCDTATLDLIKKEVADSYHSIYGDAVVGVFLYGSYARGDYNEYSDIDITAIVKGNRLDLQEKLQQVWDIAADIGLEHDIVISPTVIPENEFNKYLSQSGYYANIAKEGIRIG